MSLPTSFTISIASLIHTTFFPIPEDTDSVNGQNSVQEWLLDSHSEIWLLLQITFLACLQHHRRLVHDTEKM